MIHKGLYLKEPGETFDFTQDLAHCMNYFYSCDDIIHFYIKAGAEARSVIRQRNSPGIDRGIFEPLPGTYFVLIPQRFDPNSQYFVSINKSI